METESRGVKFYSAASKLVTKGTTRRAFLAMLADEKDHYTRLKERWDSLIAEHPEAMDAPVFLHFDFEALKKIFPSREQITRNLKAEISEEEALRIAMQMEKDAYRFFSEYAEKFNDTRGRDIFRKFAKEEQEHIDLIQAACEELRASN
jgi:rubrerythrin